VSDPGFAGDRNLGLARFQADRMAFSFEYPDDISFRTDPLRSMQEEFGIGDPVSGTRVDSDG